MRADRRTDRYEGTIMRVGGMGKFSDRCFDALHIMGYRTI